MRAAAAGPLAELLRYRHLLVTLTWRDIRVRYKQSLLGIVWAMAMPLSMMLVFTFVFTRAVAAPVLGDMQVPYPLFAFVGLVPWMFFSTSLTSCVNSLVANRNLITKVYFPREVFPLSSVGSGFADYLVAMSVLLGLMAYYRFSGQWSVSLGPSLVVLPIVLGIQIVLTVGLGLMLSMANLFYRDVKHLVSIGIQLAMFISGVVIPVPTDGSTLAYVLSLNPMVPLMLAYRDCMLLGHWPDVGGLGYAATVAMAWLVIGWFSFRKASTKFAECI